MDIQAIEESIEEQDDAETDEITTKQKEEDDGEIDETAVKQKEDDAEIVETAAKQKEDDREINETAAKQKEEDDVEIDETTAEQEEKIAEEADCGSMLILRRALQTQINIKINCCEVCANVASTTLMEKLRLSSSPHPQPYELQWLSNNSNVQATRDGITVDESKVEAIKPWLEP